MYSEKATKFCEISTLLLSYAVPVKSKVVISQNFVAFSENMNIILWDKVQIFDEFQNEEAYICIYSKRDHDAILFTHEGGIDIGNVEDKAKILIVKVGEEDTLNKGNLLHSIVIWTISR